MIDAAENTNINEKETKQNIKNALSNLGIKHNDQEILDDIFNVIKDISNANNPETDYANLIVGFYSRLIKNKLDNQDLLFKSLKLDKNLRPKQKEALALLITAIRNGTIDSDTMKQVKAKLDGDSYDRKKNWFKKNKTVLILLCAFAALAAIITLSALLVHKNTVQDNKTINVLYDKINTSQTIEKFDPNKLHPGYRDPEWRKNNPDGRVLCINPNFNLEMLYTKRDQVS